MIFPDVLDPVYMFFYLQFLLNWLYWHSLGLV